MTGALKVKGNVSRLDRAFDVANCRSCSRCVLMMLTRLAS